MRQASSPERTSCRGRRRFGRDDRRATARDKANQTGRTSMKTITTLLATSCVAIALATPALAAELRFTIWTGNEAHLKMLNGYAEGFKATHPDTTVKFEVIPPGDYTQKLTFQLAG